jgi:hypothetical protein
MQFVYAVFTTLCLKTATGVSAIHLKWSFGVIFQAKRFDACLLMTSLFASRLSILLAWSSFTTTERNMESLLRLVAQDCVKRRAFRAWTFAAACGQTVRLLFNSPGALRADGKILRFRDCYKSLCCNEAGWRNWQTHGT